MAAPYYPGMTTTPNLGLSLIGMDEVTAEDFVILDAFAGGVSGSIEINGSVVETPNFINSASVTFSVSGSNISLTSSGSGSGSGLNISVAGTASPTPVFPNPEAPSTVAPSVYVEDVNDAWHQMAGMDVSTVMSSNQGTDGNPTNPQGILVWDRMMYFRDTQNSVQNGKNAFLSVNHLVSVGTSYNNQDRSLWIGMGNMYASIVQFSVDGSNNVTYFINGLTTGFAAENAFGFREGQRVQASGLSTGTYLNGVSLSVQSASTVVAGVQTIVCSDAGFTHSAVSLTFDNGTLNQVIYSMANIQMEQDVVGTPVFVSAVDSELSTLSVQMSDQHAGTAAAPNYGCNAIRAQFYREPGAGNWGSVQSACIRSLVTDSNNGTQSSETINNLLVLSSTVSGNNDTYNGIYVQAPLVRFGTATNGLVIENFGGNSSDYSLKVLGGQTSILGTLTLGTLAAVAAWPSTSATFVLAGPSSGSAAAAAFRALVNTDIPAFTGDSGTGGTLGGVPAPGAGDAAAGKFLSAGGVWSVPSGGGGGSVAWSSITSAAAGLTLANGSNATEFDQTSAVIWAWKNTTVATGTTNQSSPIIKIAGRYFSGADAEDNWTLQDVVANGTNKLSQLVFTHTGTSGPAQIQVPANAGSTNTPSLVFGSSSNTGGTYGPGFFSPAASVIGVHPGDGSGNVQIEVRFYRINSGTPTLSFDMASNSSSSGGMTFASSENTNSLQPITLAAVAGTATGIAVALGGNGGNNSKDFSATSGSQVGVSVGNTSAQGRLTFNPASGAATFVAFQVIPTINQTGSASGSYTALLVNPTETAVLGATNKLMDLQVGGSSKMSVDNTGKVTAYTAIATVKNGIPSLVATTSLTGQTAAISASTLYAIPAGKAGLYRISYSATITTAGTSSVLGGTNGFQSVYTSLVDGQAKTFIPTTPIISSANTLGTEISGVLCANAQASTNLQFNFGYTSTGTAMVYALEAYVEYLG